MDNNIEIDYLLHEGKQHGLEDHIDWILENKDKYNLIIEPDAGSNDYEYHNKCNYTKQHTKQSRNRKGCS